MQHVQLVGCVDQRAGVQTVRQNITELSVTKTDALLPLTRVKMSYMALSQYYLQDDSWRHCSDTPKLVYVSQNLRQPVNLYNPVFI